MFRVDDSTGKQTIIAVKNIDIINGAVSESGDCAILVVMASGKSITLNFGDNSRLYNKSLRVLNTMLGKLYN